VYLVDGDKLITYTNAKGNETFGLPVGSAITIVETKAPAEYNSTTGYIKTGEKNNVGIYGEDYRIGKDVIATLYVKLKDNGDAYIVDEDGNTVSEEESLSSGNTVLNINLTAGNIPKTGSAKVSVKKTVTGAYTVSNSYEFTLYQTNAKYEYNASSATELGSKSITVKTGNTGSLSFDVLNFKNTGTYYYVVVEKDFTNNNVKKDTTIHKLKLTVENVEGKNTLKTTWTNVSGTKMTLNNTESSVSIATVEFNNETLSGDGKVKIKKTVSGNNSVTESYEFVLYSADKNYSNLKKIQSVTSKVTTGGEVEAEFDLLSYTYSKVGTYYYVVKETAGKNADICYDSTVHKLKVVVSDVGDKNHLQVTISNGGKTSMNISNVAAAKATDSNYSTVTVAFKNLTPKADYVFKVEKLASGTNEITKTYTFNLYETKAGYSIDGLKPIQTKSITIKHSPSGTKSTVSFDTLTATFKDVGSVAGGKGYKYYVITEAAVDDADVEGSAMKAQFKVTLEDKKDGTMAATIANDGTTTSLEGEKVSVSGNTATATFRNNSPEGEGQFVVKKTAKGENEVEETYYFNLYKTGADYSTDGLKPLQTKSLTIKASPAGTTNTVNFDLIKWTLKNLNGAESLVEHYVVTETIGSNTAVHYDETVSNLKVTITNLHNGTFKVECVNEGTKDATIVNSGDSSSATVSFLNLSPKTSIQIFAKKEIEYRNLENVTFTFVLKDEKGNVIDTKVTTSSKKAEQGISFDPITYTLSNLYEGNNTFKEREQYTYTVEEDLTDAYGYIIYSDSKDVTVTISRSKDHDKMYSSTTSPESNPVTLTNRYWTEGSLTITGEKTFVYGDLTTTSFKMNLYEADENGSKVGDAIATAYTSMDEETLGQFSFKTIQYTGHLDKDGNEIESDLDVSENLADGYYKDTVKYYVVSEEDTNVDGVIYDKSEYLVKVTLHDNKEGQILTSTEITKIKDAEGNTVNEKAYSSSLKFDENSNKADFTNYLIRGGVVVYKFDRDTMTMRAQGDATLEGNEFTITNVDKIYDSEAEDGAGKWYEAGEFVMTLTTKKVEVNGETYVLATTDADYAVNGENYDITLPYGHYTITETKASEGYLLTDSTAREFFVDTMGEVINETSEGKSMLSADEAAFVNEVKRGGYEVWKVDAETEKGEAQAPYSFEGVKVGIYNVSEQYVYVNEEEYEPSEEDLVYVITLNKEGYGKTEPDALPYGTYFAKEIEVPDAYKLNEDWKDSFRIREDQLIVSAESKIKNAIKRGDNFFIKLAINGEKLANIPFEIQFLDYDEETGEAKGILARHVIVSDENGVISTRNYTGSVINHKFTDGKWMNQANSLDAYVKDGVYSGPLDSSVGVWFGDSEPYADAEGAMIYGYYRIVELSCETNEGKDLLESNVFKLEEDGSVTSPSVKGLLDDDWGIMVNLDIILESEALDVTSMSHSTGSWDAVPVQDKLTFQNLKANQKYRVTTFYMIGEEEVGRTQMEFVAGDENVVSDLELDADTGLTVLRGSVTSKGEIDLSAYEGQTVSAVSYLEADIDGIGWVEVKNHNTEMDIESQMVYVIGLSTEAKDTTTGDHVGYAEGITYIEDTVSLTNLQPSTQYLLEMTVVDAETEEVVAGPVYRAFTSDRAKADAGKLVVDAEIVMPQVQIDGEAYKGKTLVVYENLYYASNASASTEGANGKAVEDSGKYYVKDSEAAAKHTDSKDAKQSIYYPNVITNAHDYKTEINLGTVENPTTFVDVVTYTNLIVDEEYVITGELRYQKDVVYEDTLTGEKTVLHKAGDLVTDKNGNPYTSSVTLEAGKHPANGAADMTFEIDVECLEGSTIVAFEKLYHEVCVASHCDLKSPPQTVYYPYVHTTAVDKATGTNVGVSYSGTINTEEELKEAEAELAEQASKTTIIDTVAYRVVAGFSYRIEGVLMNSDGSVYKDADGNEVRSYVTFDIPEQLDEQGMPVTVEDTIEVTFGEFNGTNLEGKSVVVFEKLYVYRPDTDAATTTEQGEDGYILIDSHEKLDDKGQTVSYPKLRTNASDKTTKTQTGMVGEKVTIVDAVTYSNLLVDKEYVIEGTLVYKTDVLDENDKVIHKAGETVCDASGKPYTASLTLKANEHETDGVAELEFVIDSRDLGGYSLVVYESLKQNKVEVASHKDITDEDQTVNYPKVGTQAADIKTGNEQGTRSKNATLVDTVELTNLTEGETYQVKGELVTKDGKSTGITAESEKIVADASGKATVTVTFEFDSTVYEGEDIVVFEDLYTKVEIDSKLELIKVAEHRDTRDEKQTVHYPKVYTSAYDVETSSQQSHVAEKVTVKDIVIYENLIPGKTYTVQGTLYDQETGEPLTDADGNVIQSNVVEFTVEEGEENGDITVTFTFDASLLEGKTLVAFEDLYHEGKKIATHHDINDKDQSIYMSKIRTKAHGANTDSNVIAVGDTSGAATSETHVTVVDTVTYANLIPGMTYVVKGYLVYKDLNEDGEVEKLRINGQLVKSQTEFTPEESSGEVDVTFVFDATGLEGESFVVYETLYLVDTDGHGNRTDIEIAKHQDITDEAQTIVIEKPDVPPSPPAPKVPNVPKTGDTMTALYLAIFAGSALGLLALLLMKKREKKNS